MDVSALCEQIGSTFTGDMILAAVAALAGSGTLSQIDAWIPERWKNRKGAISKVVWAVVDGCAGNYNQSQNKESDVAGPSTTDPSRPPPPAG